jgi:hypothetical protein
LGSAHAVSQLNWAQSSQSMPQLHLEAAELRSPPSHQLARLGRIRRRSTHRYLEHRLESVLESMFQMTPTYEIVSDPKAVQIRFPNQRRRGRHSIRGKESKARGARPQQTGNIAAPPSGASSYSVAIVRPWLPSSESSEPGRTGLTYSSNTLCHSTAIARTHMADSKGCAPSNGTTPSSTGAAAAISIACV